LLVAGDKSGGSQKRFYKQLIAKADLRFSDHVESVRKLKVRWLKLESRDHQIDVEKIASARC